MGKTREPWFNVVNSRSLTVGSRYSGSTYFQSGGCGGQHGPALANALDELMYHGRLMGKDSPSTFWNGKVGLSWCSDKWPQAGPIERLVGPLASWRSAI